MLRTLATDVRMHEVSLKTAVKRLAGPAMVLAAAAVLARVQPMAGLAPFLMSFFAAALFAAMHPVSALLGGLTGMLGAESGVLLVPAGLLCILALYSAGRLLGRWVQRPWLRGEAAAAVAAGLGALVPGAALAAGGAWQSVRVVLMTLIAAAGAPFFRALLLVRPARRHLMPEERAGLILFLCAALAGLTGVWPPLGVTAAWLGVLTVAPLGAGSAACAGLACTGALILTGMVPGRACAFGMCGMLAGLAPPRRRWAAPLVVAVAAPAAGLMMGAPWTDSACAMIAVAAILVMPEGVLSRARAWLAGETAAACDPDRLAQRLRAESERRLRALSDAFGELSDSYRAPVDVPDEQTLIADMRARLCDGCSGYGECWAGDDNRAVRFLCQLISEAIEWSGGDCAEPLFGPEMPPDVLRQCRRGRAIPDRLGILLEDFAQQRRAELKRGAVNQLISAQFMQAQLLLCGLADVQARPLRIRGRQAVRARAALDRAGIDAVDVMALRGERRMEIVAALRHGRWSPELAARAAVQLSRTFGRPYAPDEAAGGAEMKFVRLSRLRATAAAACHSRQAGVPSGDSHVIRELDGDRLLLMISDGMGSGEEAARESAQTLRLLSQFLAAGVERDLALETVNELMLARTHADMFATVDLCLIDLASGMADFTKLAACRSLILRDGEVLTVEGGRLPLGILEGVRPSVSRILLRPGDVVLLASDGVMDAIEPSVLSECLAAHGRQPPQMLAETILALAETSSAHRDDMTALCARVAGRRG